MTSHETPADSFPAKKAGKKVAVVEPCRFGETMRNAPANMARNPAVPVTSDWLTIASEMRIMHRRSARTLRFFRIAFNYRNCATIGHCLFAGVPLVGENAIAAFFTLSILWLFLLFGCVIGISVFLLGTFDGGFILFVGWVVCLISIFVIIFWFDMDVMFVR